MSLIQFNIKEVITREDNLPYLIRRTLVKIGKYFSIKIHKIVQSDDACIHDHPWSFLSIILKGGYFEWTIAQPYDYDPEKHDYTDPFKDNIVDWKAAPDGSTIVKKWHGPGSILYRPANWAHSLELDKTIHITKNTTKAGFIDDNRYQITCDAKEVNTPCTTLVFTGKIVRKWGFYTKLGWIHWRNYTKQKHC
jgi:hypothetical protein